jgi:ribosomal protein S18 acetylase RimI-like enzyme
MYITDKVSKEDWLIVADLIAKAIPNTVISKLGDVFGALYYRKLSESDLSCAYIAKDQNDEVAGIIIGTLDFPKVHSCSFRSQLLKLFLAANFRLIHWAVIKWFIKGILHKLKSKEENSSNIPIARLAAIAILPSYKGTGLAQKLVEEMEAFFHSSGLSEPYAILTEKSNLRANSFYKKIGADLVATNTHHGRQINQWNKLLK